MLLVERRGCHLCAAAHDVLDRVAERTGHSWASVDVHGNEELLVAFGELVPLVLVDGAVAGYWRLDPARIEAALEAGS